MKYYICLIIITLMSCKSIDKNLMLVNYTKSSVWASISYDYPDTTLKFDSFTNENSPRYPKCCYNDSLQYIVLEPTWKLFSNLSSDTSKNKIYVFLYDSLLVETISPDTIREKYLILKRYEFTYGELEKMNFKIAYKGL